MRQLWWEFCKFYPATWTLPHDRQRLVRYLSYLRSPPDALGQVVIRILADLSFSRLSWNFMELNICEIVELEFNVGKLGMSIQTKKILRYHVLLLAGRKKETVEPFV